MRLARVRTAGGEILHGVVRGDSLHVIEGDLFGRGARALRGSCR